MEYSFNVYNRQAQEGVTTAVYQILRALAVKKTCKTGSDSANEPPVVVCVGSDLAIGDALGPIVGSMLKYKTQGLHTYLYGTLSAPVTAKDIAYLRKFLRETHKGSTVLTVDAAVGQNGDVGLIKVLDEPLKPGAGANKKLGSIGHASILGVVNEKSLHTYGIFNTTRLNLVYTMAEIISESIANCLWSASENGEKKGETA